MTFITKNNYIIGKTYKLNQRSSNLIVNNEDTDYIIKVIATNTRNTSYKEGDILLVDRKHTDMYTVAGEKYVAVESYDVIARVQE